MYMAYMAVPWSVWHCFPLHVGVTDTGVGVTPVLRLPKYLVLQSDPSKSLVGSVNRPGKGPFGHPLLRGHFWKKLVDACSKTWMVWEWDCSLYFLKDSTFRWSRRRDPCDLGTLYTINKSINH